MIFRQVTVVWYALLWNLPCLLQAYVVVSPVATSPQRSASMLFSWTGENSSSGNGKGGSGNDESSVLNLAEFQRRKDRAELKSVKNQLHRPPNPFLSPVELVQCLLEELRSPTSRQQHSGVMALLESSTPNWWDSLRQYVGAPKRCKDELLAPPLEAALSRPKNQFAILLGVEDVDYQATFPTDPLDFQDGTCWVECRLRSGVTDELLVVMGWSLLQRPGDGAWLVDALDWQDFRDAYRPGIGREEWMRICG